MLPENHSKPPIIFPETPLIAESDSLDNSGVSLQPENIYQTQIYTHCRERYVELEELLEFAVETGLLDPPELASDIKRLKKVIFYSSFETLQIEELCEAEAELEKLYSKLARLIAPATLDTLRATSERYPIIRPWWRSWLLGSGSLGQNFFRQIFWTGMGLFLLLFVKKYAELHIAYLGNWQEVQGISEFMRFMDPFIFGAIGAWIYLYKMLNDLYTDRRLHPKKLSTDWLRLFMGGLSGGLLVHFLISPELSPQVTEGMSALNQQRAEEMTSSFTLSVSVAVPAFLAGYSVDFFYKTLDRMIQSILPSKGVEAPPPPSQKQQQMEMLLQQLQEASAEDKEVIRELLKTL